MNKLILILVVCFAQISCKAQQNVFNEQEEINNVINLFLDSKHDAVTNKKILLVIGQSSNTKKIFENKNDTFNMLFQKDSILMSEKNVLFFKKQLRNELEIKSIKCSNIENVKLVKLGDPNNKDLYMSLNDYYKYVISKPLFTLDKKHVVFSFHINYSSGWVSYKKTDEGWKFYKYLDYGIE